MTLLLRSSLETRELQKIRETFIKAGSDGEAILQTLRQRFDNTSSSGEDTTDSGIVCFVLFVFTTYSGG